jgi:hypothetical protein
LFLELALGGAAAVLFPAGLLWVCDRLGWLSLESVFSVVVSLVFLIASGVLAVLALRIPRSKTPDGTDYSALDRILHRVAFIWGTGFACRSFRTHVQGAQGFDSAPHHH